MSPQDSAETGRGVYVEKPKSNIYTVMLILSLVAILVAITMLCLEMSEYEWNIKAPRITMRMESPGPAPQFAHGLPVADAWTGSAPMDCLEPSYFNSRRAT